MEQLLVFLLVLVAVALVALVLIQHGKGADVGAAFGSGASNTVFGSQGSTSFLFKVTLGLAIAFFVISVILTRIATDRAKAATDNPLPMQQQTQQVDNSQPITVPTAPAIPVPATK